MIKKFAITALLAAGLISGAAHAAGGIGPYMGSSVGISTYDLDNQGVPGIKINKSGTSMGLYGGYRFDKHLAAEIGYTRLGDVKVKVKVKGYNLSVPVTTDMFSASGLAYLPVSTNAEVFGRVGVAHLKTDLVGFKSKDTTVLLGAGAEYKITKNTALRGEVQYMPRGADSSQIVNTNIGLKVNF